MYLPPASAFAEASLPSPAPASGATAGTSGALATPFRTLLSELNPLQYLPVVGTLYRAVTHDTIPEAVRCIGSVIVGGLVGGPFGVATGIATLIAEKVSGIDPERIGRRLLAGVGLATPDTTTADAGATPGTALPAASSARPPAGAASDGPFTVVATAPPASPPPPSPPAASAPPASPPPSPSPASAAAPEGSWSPAQLAAYGVTCDAFGTLHRGRVSGADVLNDLELARTRPAVAAARYDAVLATAP